MTSLVPHLPTEVYANIIAQLKSESDLIFLWTVLRNVSHTFRDLVDEFVRRRHLKETHIIPDLSAPELSTLSYFSHISEDDSDIAVFTVAPDLPFESRQSLTSHRGLSMGEVVEESWTRPRALVAVRQLAKDTELPRAQWNPDSCEVSFDWRGMFGALLWEEKLRMNLSRQWVQRANAMKAAASADTTPSNPSDALMKMILSRGARDESVGRARQKRIERQIGRAWAPSREDFDFHEAVEQLQHVINAWDFED